MARWIDGDAGYGWDGFVGSYELTRRLTDGERDAALAIADALLAEPTEQLIVSELGRLRLITVSRDIGQDLALVFAIYADELKRYPADAVRSVLREWPRTEKFWPSIIELTLRLDRIASPRKALREALLRGHEPPEREDV